MCRAQADGGRRCTSDHTQDRQRRVRANKRHQQAQEQVTALIGATPFRPESADLLAMSSRDSYYDTDEWQEWSDRIRVIADAEGVTIEEGNPASDGLWLGDTEPSGAYQVTGTPEAIERWAAHVAGVYDQDAVMVLHPEGPDRLHTITAADGIDVNTALDALKDAGIDGGRVVDGRLEIVATADAPLNDEALRVLQEHLDGELTTAEVTARFIEKDEDRLAYSPIKELQGIRQRHAERHGLPIRGPCPHLTDADDIAVSRAYEEGIHDPTHPAVARSYRVLRRHITEQYNEMIAAGYTFEPHDGDTEQPYATSADMIRDLRENKRLRYYRTEASQDTEGALPAGHPMAVTVTVATPEGGTQRILANDAFRAVHDAIAHSEGHKFSGHGERLAWWTHRSSLPREAHLSLANETRAQNCYTNSGPHMRTADGGSLLRKGDAGWLPAPERPYAEQKCVRLPDSLT